MILGGVRPSPGAASSATPARPNPLGSSCFPHRCARERAHSANTLLSKGRRGLDYGGKAVPKFSIRLTHSTFMIMKRKMLFSALTLIASCLLAAESTPKGSLLE